MINQYDFLFNNRSPKIIISFVLTMQCFCLLIFHLYVMPPWASPLFTILLCQPLKKKKIFAHKKYNINTITTYRSNSVK